MLYYKMQSKERQLNEFEPCKCKSFMQSEWALKHIHLPEFRVEQQTRLWISLSAILLCAHHYSDQSHEPEHKDLHRGLSPQFLFFFIFLCHNFYWRCTILVQRLSNFRWWKLTIWQWHLKVMITSIYGLFQLSNLRMKQSIIQSHRISKMTCLVSMYLLSMTYKIKWICNCFRTNTS